MKQLRPFGIFICALFAMGAAGGMLDLILPEQEPPQPVATAAPSLAEEPDGELEADGVTTQADDIPVGSPIAYTQDSNLPVCQAALKQYVSYIEARAGYLLRTDQAKQDTSQFLESREQAVIGELAILNARSGTFQGNPDHFNQLTTLVAERLAVELASHWHRSDRNNSPRGEVPTYDVNLNC